MSGTNLHGKTALVTGAAKRIGREIALALASEGVNVIIHYRSSYEGAEGLLGELAKMGVRAWTVQADFEKSDEPEHLIENALAAAGTLDILINNASIFPKDTLHNIDFSGLVRNMQVNAWVPFVLSRDFARIVGRGNIINLIDSRVNQYDWNHAGYILSKHVLMVLTEMTAIQYAPDIRVNGIAPGLILPSAGMSEEDLDRLGHTVPLRRHGEPSSIAQAAVYLLKAEFVTGMVINVDGGLHLMEYRNGSHPDR
jgi:NAD(P)-dependent dehydrogenase (short-subunit alcohol dehydrogenase family)